jgi:hypothetical protein
MAIIQTVFGVTASYLNASQGVIVDLPSGLSWDGQEHEAIVGVQAVLGSSYNDVIWASLAVGDVVLDGGPAGADSMQASVGNTLSYVTSNSSVYVDLPAGLSWDGQNNDTIAGFHKVIGSRFDDTVWGTSGDDIITGGWGE